jgi:hypothetical protein
MRVERFDRLLFIALLHFASIVIAETTQRVLDSESAVQNGPVTISSHWDLLGPFKIGTRGTSRLQLRLYLLR